jgi:two-component system chemotaxis response regulator CheB
MSGKTIRVLVADDSVTMRNVLSALLGEDPQVKVVGLASDGAEAVAMAKALHPDVITMDVQMPRLSGLEAIQAIMAEAPARILVVCSVTEGHQVDLSFKAMAVGALELIAKPAGEGGQELRAWGRRVADSVKLMAEIPVVTRRRGGKVPVKRAAMGVGKVDVFGIASSTGGPPALATILGALPAAFPVPILIAQHMAPGFASGLLRWFTDVCQLEMVLADQGMACQPGHVYLPPDSCDIEVDREGLIQIKRSPGGHCPSGNRLLHSIAEAYGDRAGGLVLTGMGDDGSDGLLAIKRAGGITMAQDAASCVVYGMPQACLRKGAVAEHIALEAIAPTMCELATHVSGWEAPGEKDTLH